jgi:hypothetical protein
LKNKLLAAGSSGSFFYNVCPTAEAAKIAYLSVSFENRALARSSATPTHAALRRGYDKLIPVTIFSMAKQKLGTYIDGSSL